LFDAVIFWFELSMWCHNAENNNWTSCLVVWLSRNVNLVSTSEADDTCGVCI